MGNAHLSYTKSTTKMFRTSLATVIILLFCVPAFVAGQMRQVHTEPGPGLENDVQQISFYNASQGYVAFYDYIGFSSDSGHSFIKKYIGLGNVNYAGTSPTLTFGFTIYGVKSFSQNRVLVYGHYGLEPTILLSIDGGNSFTVVYHEPFHLEWEGTNGGVTDMIFPENDQVGFAVNSHAVLKTINGGQTWNRIEFNAGLYFTALEAVSNNVVFAISTDYRINRIYRTTNGGANWNLLTSPSTQYTLLAATFYTADKGWAVMQVTAGENKQYVTINGGTSWTVSGNVPAANRMHFLNDQDGYSLTLGGVYRTDDGGLIWEKLAEDVPSNGSYSNFYFLNSLQFWAGGSDGYLQLTTNGGGVPIPSAIFRIDTTGLSVNQTVSLVNLGKTTHQYKWYKNDTLISSSYNTSYVHRTYQSVDTIKLVALNNSYTDTIVQYQYFNIPPLPAYPSISSFSPQSAAMGDRVIITGANLTGTTAVSFNGSPAKRINVVSATSVEVEVGEGASGSLLLTTPVGSTSSSGFIFTSRLRISSISPESGPAGTLVAINGSNFDNQPANNRVFFGSVEAPILSASPTQLLTRVPVGISYSEIRVMVNHQSVSSPRAFNLTFPNGGELSAANFPVKTDFPMPNGAVYMNVADFDGDGKQDVLVADEAYRPIYIARNNSEINQISFEPMQQLLNSQGSIAIRDKLAIADFDGDGLVDIININRIYRNISTKGIIKFAEPQILTPVGITPHHTSGVDMNMDGKPDLVGINEGKVVIFDNTSTPGAISFAQPTRITIPGNAIGDVAAADVNNDRKPDIIVAGVEFNDPGLIVYPNLSYNGVTLFDLSYSPQRFVFPIPDARYFANIIAGDVDGDGLIDLLVRGADEGGILLRNNSINSSYSFAPGLTIPSGGTSISSFGDVNGDGKPDICSNHRDVQPSPGNIIQFLVQQNNSSPGLFSFGSSIQLAYEPGAINSLWIVSADFDGDGKTDLALPCPVKSEFSVLLNHAGDSTVIACEGGQKALTSSRIGANYRWQQTTAAGYEDLSDNSNFSGTATSVLQLNNISSSLDGTRYRCVVGGNFSRAFLLKVKTAVIASVSITQSPVNPCPGGTVTFTASVVNGGPQPGFQWLVNGEVVSGNSTGSFTSTSLHTGDQVQARLIVAANCAIPLPVASNILSVSVGSATTATVTLTASATHVCVGENITFTATCITCK